MPNAQPNPNLKNLLHKTIKKVSEDIEAMKFNTAVSSMMEFVNEWSRQSGIPSAAGHGLDQKDAADFLKILSPFAPHLAEELWQSVFGGKGLCSEQKWPKYNLKLIEEEKILLIVQVNGKVKDKIEINSGITQKQAENIVLKSEKVKNVVGKSEIKKIIFVPNKLINFVI